MLKITRISNAIKVEGLDNRLYPDNGTIVIPVNSVIIQTDESNIATFRSAANNDVLFSGLIGQIQIGTETPDKENIVSAFSNIANSSTGGGGGADYDDTELRQLIQAETLQRQTDDATLDNKITGLSESVDQKLKGYVNGASYSSTDKKINLLNGETVIAYIDATQFIKDGMVDNVEIKNSKLVITFNTDSGKEPIELSLSDIFNPDNYYTKTDIDGKNFVTVTRLTEAVEALGGEIENELTSNYQPKLVSGTNIKTVNGNSLVGSGNVTINAGVSSVGKKTDASDPYLTQSDFVSPTTGAVKVGSPITDSTKYHTFSYETTYKDWLNKSTVTDTLDSEALEKNATYLTGNTVRKAVTTSSNIPYYWFGNDPESTNVTFAKDNIYMTFEFDGTETDYWGGNQKPGHKVEMKLVDMGNYNTLELIYWQLYIDHVLWNGATDGTDVDFPMDENMNEKAMSWRDFSQTTNGAASVLSTISFDTGAQISAASDFFSKYFAIILRTDKVDGSTVLKIGGNNDYKYYKLTLKSVTTGSGMKLRANAKGDISTDNKPERLNEYIRYADNQKAYILTDKNIGEAGVATKDDLTAIETEIGNISSALDAINGETV